MQREPVLRQVGETEPGAIRAAECRTVGARQGEADGACAIGEIELHTIANRDGVGRCVGLRAALRRDRAASRTDRLHAGVAHADLIGQTSAEGDDAVEGCALRQRRAGGECAAEQSPGEGRLTHSSPASAWR